MKKIIGQAMILSLLLLPLTAAMPVGATTTPNWNVVGSYQWLAAGTYAHDLVITTQNPDGTFSGTGGYPGGGAPYTAAGQTPEAITGQVIGNAITFTSTYAGPFNPGYSVTVSGTIAPDGSMSGTSPFEWHTTSGNAVLLGSLAAQDFGVVNYDTGLGILKGYTAGFGLTDATFANVQSVVVQLYSSSTLLQTNTATTKVGATLTGADISSPFDVSGSFNYVTDGYWTNVRQAEYGQTLPATRVVATVTLANGKIVSAENDTLTGDPTTIMPVASTSTLTVPVITGSTSTQTTATINWTGSTGGVAPIVYTVLRGGTSVGTTTASTTAFTDTGLTPATTYSYAVRATDSATPTSSIALSATSTVTTLASSTGGGSTSTLPMVSISSPLDKANVSGTITIAANASDTSSAITKVEVVIDDMFGLKASTSSPYTFSLNTKLLSDGKHTLVAKAYDAAGNVGTSTVVSITVDNHGSQGNGGGGDSNGGGSSGGGTDNNSTSTGSGSHSPQGNGGHSGDAGNGGGSGTDNNSTSTGSGSHSPRDN